MVSNLWRMGICGCIPIILVLTGRLLLREYSRKYSYSLWLLVLARLLLPVFIESLFSIQPLQYMDGSRGFFFRFFLKAGGEWKEVCTCLYLAGVAVMTGVFLTRYAGTRRRVKLAVRETENIWRCEEISSAFVMGLIRPRIYLPYGLEGTSRWYVVLHEKKHIRHGDPWVRVLGTVTLCLHWWNPLVWYAVNRLYEDMEMYCDESVMEECAFPERKIYSEVLLDLAAWQSGFPGLCFGASHTEQRIRNILKIKKRERAWFLLLFYMIIQLGMRVSFTIPPEAPKQAETGEIRIEWKDSRF